MGYQTDAIKGISWISLLRIATRLLTFVRLAILGRLLTPAQFGAFGIASLLLAFLEIFTETGINVFFVQHKGPIKEYLNSAWIVSIVRGIILSFIILILAPFISSFFNAPEAFPVIMLMALVPFIRGFINPAIVTYQKELLFDKEFRLRSIIFCVDVVISVIVAFITRSAESFVWGLIASAVIEVFLSYYLFSLHPKLSFSFLQIQHILKRGSWVTLSGVFSYFADNGDNIVVGKLLGATSLGFYQVAYRFSTLPINEIADTVSRVIFPVYTKIAGDKKRLFRAFLKVTGIISISSIIFGLIIFLFGDEIILLFMGQQWVEATSVIKVLAIYGILRAIFGSISSLFLSLGRQDYVAKMTFFRVIGLIVVIIPLVNMYGIMGAGYAMLISVLIEIPIIILFCRNIFR